jgi:hypothetical protein
MLGYSNCSLFTYPKGCLALNLSRCLWQEVEDDSGLTMLAGIVIAPSLQFGAFGDLGLNGRPTPDPRPMSSKLGAHFASKVPSAAVLLVPAHEK